jgi:magnesium transporter
LEPETPVIEAADTTPLSVTPEEDQETVANLFQRYRLNSLPVTDERGRVLGQITADDVMGVLSEEATEDLYRLASMDESSDLTEPLFHSFRRRASWLTTNALAGILTATIVSLFDSSISRLPALAALMPIVANLGGMGGVQTATIIVRAMALGHMEGASYLWVTGRQALIGLLIGLFFCLTGAVIAYLFLDNLQLGLVFGASLALILLLGGILGSAIPIGLRRLGIDPALVSGGLLTTLTDAISFLLFLGLASWLLF